MKEYYSSKNNSLLPIWQGKIDSDGILTEVRSNFKGEKFKNVSQNLRFTGYFDKIACPLMISNYDSVKKSFPDAVPDAIGIGFAKSGTGSMAMLRSVDYFIRLFKGFRLA